MLHFSQTSSITTIQSAKTTANHRNAKKTTTFVSNKNNYYGIWGQIAHMVLFLCSDKAGFITGENICIDGGMTRQMIYHNDEGWTLVK